MKKCITMALIIVLLSVGCQEEQQKVWGTGDLKTDWAEMFGESNGSRLDYVQSQLINKHEKALIELLKRVQALEVENPAELAERVRKLEFINSEEIDATLFLTENAGCKNGPDSDECGLTILKCRYHPESEVK